MPLSERHQRDLQAGIDALGMKRREIELYWQYYDDIQPPKYLSEKMQEAFRGLKDRFSLNLCKLAITTPLNRLWVQGWESPQAKEMWHRLRLDREQKRIYKHALVAGESYVVGWRGLEGEAPQLAFNDPRIVHLFFRADQPGTKEFAVKVWQERDETVRGVIYYPDSIVRVVAEQAATEHRDLALQDGPPVATAVSAGNFEYDPVDPGGEHAMGEVPVWRFSQDLWQPESRLKDLIPVQDVINKLRSNKMVAAESGAFPQRVYFTMQDLNAEELRHEPHTSLVLDPGDRESPASVEQFEAASLEGYDESISAEVQNFFTVAHLPRHLLISPGADSSGDAIRSDEGPFQEMVRDMATNFGYTWADMMSTLTQSDDEAVTPDWQDSRINNAEAQAREFQALVEGSMPPAYAAVKAFQWDLEDAREANLLERPVDDSQEDDFGNRERTQTTEDNPQ